MLAMPDKLINWIYDQDFVVTDQNIVEAKKKNLGIFTQFLIDYQNKNIEISDLQRLVSLHWI